jgi:hypothetical protein
MRIFGRHGRSAAQVGLINTHLFLRLPIFAALIALAAFVALVSLWGIWQIETAPVGGTGGASESSL